MAKGTFLQTSFLGGEFSPYMQGRMDDLRYRSGMNVCRNYIPVEEGAATRRPGTRFVAPTFKGRTAILRQFDFNQAHPYNLELTPGHMRFVSGARLVVELNRAVVSISSTTPAVIETGVEHEWATLDQVEFALPDGDTNTGTVQLLQRQFEITVIDPFHFSIADPVTGTPFNGSTVSLGGTNVIVSRVVDIITPWVDDRFADVRTVQSQSDLLLLQGGTRPQVLSNVTPPGALNTDYATFVFAPSDFLDGPYLDPPTDGSTVAASGLSGSVTLTKSGGDPWVSTDVGRLIRLFSEPAEWNNATGYAIGDQVKFNEGYYSAIKANTGKQPDFNIADWAVDTTAAMWTWAQFTAVASANSATATIRGDNILRTTPCRLYRMGLFSNTTGWPTCGTFHEGRFWLSGVVDNRLDSSKANDVFNMAPTSPDGTVADDNAISAIMQSDSQNTVFWMVPDQKGIIVGTQHSEWVVQASNQNDPLTPTSIQAHEVTTTGSSNQDAIRAGVSIAFVQRYERKLMEYVTDPRGFVAKNLSETGRHLSSSGIAEIAYQRELTPVLWARMKSGSFAGMSYRRQSPFASEPPDFAGWHRHDLGSGYAVISIQGGPSVDGKTDSLAMVTRRLSDGVCFIELLSPIFDQDSEITSAFFVDKGIVPSLAEILGTAPNQYVRLYGLFPHIGETVAIWAAGLDLGDFLIQPDGTVDLPLDQPGSYFTTAWLAQLTATGSTFDGLGVVIKNNPGGMPSGPIFTGIQEYFCPADDVVGVTGDSCIPDWDNNRLYLISAGSFSGPAGFRALDMTTGAQLYDKAIGDVDPAGRVARPVILGTDGFIYYTGLDTNIEVVYKLDKSNFTLVSSFGTSGDDRFTSDLGLMSPASWVSIDAGRHLIISCSDQRQIPYLGVQGGGEVAAVNTDTMTWTGFAVQLDEYRGAICRGKRITLGSYVFASAYVLGHDPSTSSITPLGLYRVGADSNGVIGISSIGKITLADIDAGWTEFVVVQGLVYDELHDQVIFQASTTANVTKLVCLSCADASVVWTVGVPSMAPNDGCINASRIRYGKYGFFSPGDLGIGARRFWLINTFDGSFETDDVIGVLPGAQVYDDTTARLIFYGDYTSTTPGAPAPIGGTSSFDGRFATFGPVDAPPGATTYSSPFAIGYSYVSQGQTLRPISPAESGADFGPSFGKTQRAAQFAVRLHKTQGMQFGSLFAKMHDADLKTNGGTQRLTPLQLFSGTQQDTLQNNYTFESALAWEQTRPYPGTVLAAGLFMQTQDRG